MAEHSKISWTHASWSPWEGCSKCSEGCQNCYADAGNKRWRGGRHWGTDAPRRMMSENYWREPMKWQRQVAKGKKPRPFYVFVGHLCDLFEDYHGPSEGEVDAARARFFDMVAHLKDLTLLLLTKRPDNVLNVIPASWQDEWPANVWLGVTAETQERADERVPELLRLKSELGIPVAYVSVEPALGEIDLTRIAFAGAHVDGFAGAMPAVAGMDWVICGGESQKGCRPFDERVARSLRDQCAAAGVPFFMKQLGGHPDPRSKLEDLPEDLRVREFPEVNRQGAKVAKPESESAA